MGFHARKTDYVACEQQKGRSACASAQSDQRLLFSLSGNDSIQTFFMQNLIILAGLCS